MTKNLTETNENRRNIENLKIDKECDFQQNAKELEGGRKTGERIRIRKIT